MSRENSTILPKGQQLLAKGRPTIRRKPPKSGRQRGGSHGLAGVRACVVPWLVVTLILQRFLDLVGNLFCDCDARDRRQ